MSMSASASGSRVSEINVTPLIDILLVLLIIFMVIVPVVPRILETAIPLPPRSAAPQPPPPSTTVVEVLSAGHGDISYQINGTVLDKARLEPELAEIFATREDKVMFVKGDRELDYSKIAEVIDLAKQAGAANVGVLTPQSEAGR